MLIRLQRIYNFWLFDAVILSFLDVLQSFILILYHFLVLTYWHSAKCQLLFSACFLHCRKSISNGAQTQRVFLWIFLGQKISCGPEKRLGVLWGEHNPPGHAWRPRRALVGCAHLGCPRTASLIYIYPNIGEEIRGYKQSCISKKTQITFMDKKIDLIINSKFIGSQQTHRRKNYIIWISKRPLYWESNERERNPSSY